MSTASVMSCTVRTAAMAASLLAASAAQVPAATTVVLTETTGAFRSQLLAVDGTGGVAAFGRFPSDGLRPLALAVDALDRHAIVAVELVPGASRVLRLLPAGSLAFAGEVVLADLPGPCLQLCVAGEVMFAVVGGSSGGVYRFGRRGGLPVQAVSLPHACAMLAFGGSDVAIVLWSGATTPPSAPGLVHVDTATGQLLYGPFVFGNLVGAEPTGLIDLPTALSRQLISFADGTYALHVGGLGDPTPVPMSPQPPPGGAAAFVPDGSYGFSGLAVGSAAAPALYRADWSGSVNVLAFPLPGSPVDVAAPLSALPQVLTFGDACGLPTLQPIHGVMGPPQIGNLSFDLRVGNALPGQLVFFVWGFDDVLGGALPLPVLGCPLHNSADTIDWLVSNPGGLAVRNIPIPSAPQLDGAILFSQWAQFGPAGLAASPGIAVQVGF